VASAGYEVEYEHAEGGAVPVNPRARLGAVDVFADGVFDVDIPMVALQGSFTLDQQTPPESIYDDGIVRLVDEQTGATIELANINEGGYAVNVVPGFYDIFFAAETVGELVPQNVAAYLGGVEVAADMSYDVDVPTATLQGSLTIGGQAPPESAYQNGRIYLRNLETGDAVLLGDTRDGGYQAVVTPGEYGVFFSAESASAVVPENSNGIIAIATIGGDQTLDIDVPVVSLAGSFMLDGTDPPTEPANSARVHLRTQAAGDSVALGETHELDYDARVIPGVYDVVYDVQSNQTGEVPANPEAVLSCVIVE
jgi:hypothetical protein